MPVLAGDADGGRPAGARAGGGDRTTGHRTPCRRQRGDERLSTPWPRRLRQVPVIAGGHRRRPRRRVPWSARHGVRRGGVPGDHVLAWPGQEPRLALAAEPGAHRADARARGWARWRRRSATNGWPCPCVGRRPDGPVDELAPQATLSSAAGPTAGRHYPGPDARPSPCVGGQPRPRLRRPGRGARPLRRGRGGAGARAWWSRSEGEGADLEEDDMHLAARVAIDVVGPRPSGRHGALRTSPWRGASGPRPRWRWPPPRRRGRRTRWAWPPASTGTPRTRRPRSSAASWPPPWCAGRCGPCACPSTAASSSWPWCPTGPCPPPRPARPCPSGQPDRRHLQPGPPGVAAGRPGRPLPDDQRGHRGPAAPGLPQPPVPRGPPAAGAVW